MSIINGTVNNDNLYGTSISETIYGWEGNDSILADGGNDVVSAGGGDDTVYGGNGADSLFGEYGDDMMSGDYGDDSLSGGAGNDYLEGGADNDEIYGENDSDTLYGGAGNDYINGGNDNDTIYGDDGDDIITGEGGNNQLYGGNGNDTIYCGCSDTASGGAGNDIYSVSSTTDSIIEDSNAGIDTVVSSVDYTLGANVENLELTDNPFNGYGNSLDNIIIGNVNQNKLYGYAGNDTLVGSINADTIYGGVDTLYGGTGDDSYFIDASVTDIVVENANEGTDTVFSDISYTLGANVENLQLNASTAISGVGNSLDNIILGNASNNSINGLAGSDVLVGAEGNDVYSFGSNWGQDTISDISGADEIDFTNALQSDLVFTKSDNNLVISNINTTDTVTIIDWYNGNKIETVKFSDYSTITSTQIETLASSIEGTDGDDNLVGNIADNNINGLGGNDTLDGGAGNDTLDGGTGLNTLIGGTGNDTFIVNNAGNTIIENTDEGIDTVVSTISYSLDNNVENLTLSGNDTISGTGNDLANTIIGNNTNNIINGGAGNDNLLGGSGDDEYVFSTNWGQDIISDVSGIDKITFTDILQSDVSFNKVSNNLVITNINTSNSITITDWFLGNRVETIEFGDSSTLTYSAIETILLTINGTASDDNLVGTSDNNIINGFAGNDTINGGVGADSMYGGEGNDNYIVDNSADIVSENANEGTDTVISSVSYTLANNVENLTLSGSANINGYGNADTNTIIGNAGNNIIDGGLSADNLQGGSGNDIYYVDDINDVVTENFNEGNDTVNSAISYTLGSNLENLSLSGSDAIDATGNELNNLITGNSGDNVIVGNVGNDTLVGGAGNDIYKFTSGFGQDTITDLSGVDEIDFDNSLQSNYRFTQSGNDLIIQSQSSTDKLAVTGWFSGNIVETFKFSDNSTINESDVAVLVKTVYGTDNNDNLSGTADNNVMYGYAGNDTINGLSGIDTMEGSIGNDVYYVDNVSDVIVENLNEGTDTVISSISYTLNENLESLSLSGSSVINGIGNEFDNIINGNSSANNLVGLAGNDTINGGQGADTLNGGIGDDTYYVDNVGDVVTEGSDEGTDTVISTVTYTIGNNVENLTLGGSSAINAYGNSGDNLLVGNSANNYLVAGVGVDTAIGGAGNDTYYIDNELDVVVENANEGTDRVISSVSYSLSSNVENLSLSGPTAFNAYGNGLANILSGTSSNNVLDGGAGIDTMSGEAGDDTYYVDNTADVIVETLNQGTDSLISSVTYTLSDNIENAQLTGTSNVNLYGNSLSNILIGNDGDNVLDDTSSSFNDKDTLYGGAGNDRLYGGVGGNLMYGGTGNDTYYVYKTTDTVVEDSGVDSGIDTVISYLSSYTLASNLENLTLSMSSTVNGTGNILDNLIKGGEYTNNNLYGLDGNDTIFGYGGNDLLNGGNGDDILDGGTGNDTLYGGAGNDTFYVDSVSDIIYESTASGVDTVNSSISYTLGANLENLTLIGNSNVNCVGNSLDNFITGNLASNTITAGIGNDTIDGGAGNDSLVGGDGNDTYIFGSGSGLDNVNDSSGVDSISFNSSISKSNIALFMNGNNLEISYSTSDKLTVLSQSSANNKIDAFNLSNGEYLSSADVNLLIQQIATYATNNGITLSSISDVKNNQDLMIMCANAWHS